MVLLDATTAGTLVTNIVTYLTDNWTAVLIVLAFGIGLALFRGIMNRSTRGRI